MGKKSLATGYMWLLAGAGVALCVHSALRLQPSEIDLRFLLIFAFTVLVGSRVGISIPKTQAEINISDVFVFLTLLLYGGEAAVLLAATEALYASLRFARKWLTRLFNAGLLAVSTFTTASLLHLYFGDVRALPQSNDELIFIYAVFLMAFVQYGVNAGLATAGAALRTGRPFWRTWHEHFLWTSITYFAGASAAGIIAKSTITLGTPALLIAFPLLAVIYFTYRTYSRNLLAAEEHAAEQQRISRALRESEERFRKAFDHAAGMAIVATDGRWLQVNQSLCDILGRSKEELLETNYQTLTHPDDLSESLLRFYRLVEGETQTVQSEKRYVHKEGREVWVLQSMSVVRDDAGRPVHLIFQLQNITERKLAERQVQHAAFHDALTDLPNRALLADRLALALARAKRNAEHRFAVLFLDLDRFKVINDSLGHSMGDRLLVELSERLQSCVRQMDTVARLGGDEFAIVLEDVNGTYDSIHIAERIQESLSEPFDLNGHQFFASCSIGIAYSKPEYAAPEDILRDADAAMYRAKANGKARYEVFDAEMHERAIEMLKLETDLRRAIEAGEISLEYQPIYSLGGGSLEGFEALARWRHPQHGLIPPDRFIPLAEESGLIVPLGEQVLRKACAQLAEWRALYDVIDRPITMSVNISGMQFVQDGLVSTIERALSENSLSSQHLRLEITESVIMENAGRATETLERLKSLGVQLSIDDFGTGYSSLSYLHRFPFDILKIDRSFVSRMTTDKESEGIVETILTLASKLGKRCVAEGIEDNTQLERLRAFGCQYGQGYLFSKPLAPGAAVELVEAEQNAGRTHDAADARADKAALINDAYTM